MFFNTKEITDQINELESAKNNLASLQQQIDEASGTLARIYEEARKYSRPVLPDNMQAANQTQTIGLSKAQSNIEQLRNLNQLLNEEDGKLTLQLITSYLFSLADFQDIRDILSDMKQIKEVLVQIGSKISSDKKEGGNRSNKNFFSSLFGNETAIPVDVYGNPENNN